MAKGYSKDLRMRAIELVESGESAREAARILNLGVKTVETHRAAAHRKLGFSSAANLVRYAVRNRMVEA